MNKILPLAIIVVGGVMIYGGINGDNPLTVFKGILTGTYVPKKSQAQVATDALNNPTAGTISAATSPGIVQHLGGNSTTTTLNNAISPGISQHLGGN